MSNIIKSSNIVGVYKLKDKKIERKQLEIDEDGIVIGEKETDKIELGEEYIENAHMEAEKIISKAKVDADKIIEQAEQEAKEILETVRDNGYQQGFEKGEKEGYEKGYEEGYQNSIDLTSKARTTMEKVINDIHSELESEVEQLSNEIINLAVEIASRVVNTRLEVQPSIINNIIQEIVRDMRNIEKVDIFIHPDLLDYINQEELNNTLVKQIVNIKGDNNLDIGDCIVESELGGRDGSISTKLDLLERELLKGAGFHEKT